MAVSVKVTVEDHSDECLEFLDVLMNTALEKCGLVAEGYAKRLCPVDTGRLRNSITHTTRSEPGPVEYIGTNVEYAPYVELGTKRTKAQPYLKPAIADHVDEYKQIIQDELKGG